MNKFLVSVNGAPAIECFVESRALRLAAGALCEVAIDGRFRTCLIDRIGSVSLAVRVLPGPRWLTANTFS